MRQALSTLDGKSFAVAVVGAGVNGASAAQHLAAAGHDVVLVDKGDFGAGSSSRSSRLLHCGLRYLAPGESMWDFVRSPNKLRIAVRMARQAMQCRAQMVETAPERTEKANFCFPIYAGGAYAPWQVSLAFRLLERLGPASVPLGYKRIKPNQVAAMPLVRWLRDRDKLLGLAMFDEYRFEWPERICMDTVLDAERLGAVARNYTPVTAIKRAGEGWQLTLADQLQPGATASVRARIVLNMAGIWIDRVNASAGSTAHKYITGTKGAHIMVRLPPECANYGIATINRVNEPFYCFPWRGMHYFGPTETLYEGDPDDIRASDDEIDWLIDETNHMLPALNLRREHVLFTWAGVRPLGADPGFPKGIRSREVHDLASDGMPGVYAMTAGPIMTHRSAGVEMAELVASKLKPSRARQAPSYAASRFPENRNSPALLDDYTAIKLSDLQFAAQNQHATSLIDLLFRRVGAGWTATMGYAAADKAAQAVAETMGWDRERMASEVREYRAYLERLYRVRPGHSAPQVQPRA
ncbi:MAG TPA: FAD-dependent oxidoreductase [Alphaproteobacteria bacterium]|nr:FAD-dependent oxidoreductase [Alphaproteobacteria bacterium]